MFSIETRLLRTLSRKDLPAGARPLPPSILCEKSGAHFAYVPGAQFETFSRSSDPSTVPAVLEPGDLWESCGSDDCPPSEDDVPHRAEKCRPRPVTVRLEKLTVRIAQVFPV